MSLRKVVDNDHDQNKVWSKVGEINEKNKTNSSTKTYTVMDNSSAFKRNIKKYLDFFNAKLSSDADLIGVVIDQRQSTRYGYVRNSSAIQREPG